MRPSPISSYKCMPLPLLYTTFSVPFDDLNACPFWWDFIIKCPLLIPFVMGFITWPLLGGIVSERLHAAISPV